MENLHSIDLLGNSSIGIFAFATNTYAFFPYATKPKALETAQNTLSVPITLGTIANCNLVGLFAVGNSSNLIIPDLISEVEYDTITSNMPEDVAVHTLNSKITALGNSIVCSDKIALAHSEFTKEDVNLIEDFLDVEVIQKKIQDNSLVGSMIFKNDKGLLTHPLISFEELEWLSNTFDLRGDVVTINRGTPYPRPGIVGNNNGILVGSDSSGPELMRVFEILLA
ncbi:MAG: translation initiation factor IF-6 [Candidatus Kariarchaeaceae archaeon]|jgi:translation initiation factor 6